MLVAAVEQGPWSPFDRLAALRDAAGELVGYTEGSTACLFPIEPSTYVTFGADGREHVIRCKTCLPCRRFEQHRLQRALVETFREVEGDLWLIEIQCPQTEHARVARRFERSRTANCWSGFFRLGSSSVALIAVGQKPHLSALRASWRYAFSCVKIRRSRGRRAFARVTSGLLASRDEYGRWVNRYYLRGLKRPERDPMTKATGYTKGIRRRHLITRDDRSVRAWKDGISIHLPAAIAAPKVIRRRGAWERRVAGGMSTVDSVLGRLFGGNASVIAAGQSPASCSSVTGFRIARAGAAAVRARGDGASAPVPRVPTSPGGRASILEARPYSGSSQSPAPDLVERFARMADLARKRGKPPDE